MESKVRVVIRRTDGVYVNLKFEPVKNLSGAARFYDIDEYEHFMQGHYKPPDASLYKPQRIKITYEEVNEDGDHEAAPSAV
jgi:hypothetical protein